MTFIVKRRLFNWYLHYRVSNVGIVQRFSEVPDQLAMVVLSVIPENPLLWPF